MGRDKLQDRQKQSAASFFPRKSPPCNLKKKHLDTQTYFCTCTYFPHTFLHIRRLYTWVCGGGTGLSEVWDLVSVGVGRSSASIFPICFPGKGGGERGFKFLSRSSAEVARPPSSSSSFSPPPFSREEAKREWKTPEILFVFKRGNEWVTPNFFHTKKTKVGAIIIAFKDPDYLCVFANYSSPPPSLLLPTAINQFFKIPFRPPPSFPALPCRKAAPDF